MRTVVVHVLWIEFNMLLCVLLKHIHMYMLLYNYTVAVHAVMDAVVLHFVMDTVAVHGVMNKLVSHVVMGIIVEYIVMGGYGVYCYG